MKQELIQALRSHAQGEINYHKANVTIYLNNPVGIGEHSNVVGAISDEIDQIAKYHDQLEVIERYFKWIIYSMLGWLRTNGNQYLISSQLLTIQRTGIYPNQSKIKSTLRVVHMNQATTPNWKHHSKKEKKRTLKPQQLRRRKASLKVLINKLKFN